LIILSLQAVKTLSQERVFGLIGRLYDAAADPSLWDVFLQDVSVAIDATATAVIYANPQTRRGNFMFAGGLDPDCQRQYAETFSAFDPIRDASLARFHRARPEAIQTGEELVGPDLKRTEYYNDFLLVHDVPHNLSTPIAIHREWVANLSCNRGLRKGPFCGEEVALMRSLFPHLQRAIDFHRKFAELEGQQRASLDALDRVAVGVVLLDREGGILVANREAEEVFRQNDGLHASKGGIHADLVNENRAIRLMISQAAKTAVGEGSAVGGSVGISRRSGKRSFAVLVAPVARRAFPEDARSPAVILFVTDPERKPEAATGVLMRIYGLTAAESRLAELLMEGESVVHAAERLCVSHNTVRTHLQRVFEKTRTRHQGELVGLLVGSAAVLRDPPHGGS
jgi:DNA-binding CsgD family transcriptional regulator